MNHETEYIIYYYKSNSGREIIKDFIESLEPVIEARVTNSLILLKKYGFELLKSNTIKKISSKPNLYELRTTGSTQVRLLFIQYKASSFLILHGFVKKAQKIPEKDKLLGLKRAKEMV